MLPDRRLPVLAAAAAGLPGCSLQGLPAAMTTVARTTAVPSIVVGTPF